MKLKHPLRYYLHLQHVDVGGVKVPYTPANETDWEIFFEGQRVARLRIIGGYSFVGEPGAEVVEISKRYAGE